MLHSLCVVASVKESQPDVLLKHGHLFGIGTVAWQSSINAERFLVIVERLIGSRRFQGLLTGLDQVLLGFLQTLGPAVMIGEHPVEFMEFAR